MNNNENIEIYKKYVDFLFYSMNLCRKFPKSEKFTLTTEINSSILKGFRILMYAIEIYDKRKKLVFLKQIDIELKVLKMYIRISYKQKYISLQNYETWCKQLTEICNMLGGWINSCLKK